MNGWLAGVPAYVQREGVHGHEVELGLVALAGEEQRVAVAHGVCAAACAATCAAVVE